MSTNPWDIHQARTLYNIEHWSNGYFDINEQGELTVSPLPGQKPLSLFELAKNFTSQGLSFPVLVRFPDILRHRVMSLCDAFATAMQQENYQAHYTAVYPIKVNQQHHVVQEILSSGEGRVGLEAGSKSELMAVLALAPTQSIVICNGYKDREYIRLALIGQQLGLRPYLVVEKVSELALILEESRQFNLIPHLGLRVRLASIGKGKWQNTGGEKSKFGLSAAQILEIITRLKEHGRLEALQLMHFHIGSQVANIRDIQQALREAARYYVEFRSLNIPIEIFDIGGGLGIDYDGTQSRTACSMNYTIQDYAYHVVHELGSVCHAQGLPHPHIISESGGAMTAHHAVLITNVIDVENVPNESHIHISPEEPTVLRNLREGLDHLNQRSALEIYHDAVHWLTEAHAMFTHGVLELHQRAKAEQLYYAICWQVYTLLKDNPHYRAYREVIDALSERLADKYFCNFSLFQSVPDAWAIEQLFPILPLHRLNEQPDRRARIQDLTCDSDGQFEHYVDGEGVGTSLAVHTLRPHEPYILGIFLVGAYQEILGDMHNLFGDTYSVNVHFHEDGSYEWISPLEGDTVQTLLNYVNFDTGFLRNSYRKRLQAAPLTAQQRQAYLRELEAGLVGYTYLEE